jgi:hypothetical protein
VGPKQTVTFEGSFRHSVRGIVEVQRRWECSNGGRTRRGVFWRGGIISFFSLYCSTFLLFHPFEPHTQSIFRNNGKPPPTGTRCPDDDDDDDDEAQTVTTNRRHNHGPPRVRTGRRPGRHLLLCNQQRYMFNCLRTLLQMVLHSFCFCILKIMASHHPVRSKFYKGTDGRADRFSIPQPGKISFRPTYDRELNSLCNMIAIVTLISFYSQVVVTAAILSKRSQRMGRPITHQAIQRNLLTPDLRRCVRS